MAMNMMWQLKSSPKCGSGVEDHINADDRAKLCTAINQLPYALRSEESLMQ